MLCSVFEKSDYNVHLHEQHKVTNCTQHYSDIKLYNLIYHLRQRAGGAYLSPHNGTSEGKAKHLSELWEPRPGQQAEGHLKEQSKHK